MRNRLTGWCAKNLPDLINIDFDLNAFIHRLILFDTYILNSLNLKEFPYLIKLFGLDGTLILLSSKAIRLRLFDFHSIVRHEGLPQDCFSFGLITPTNREELFNNRFQNNIQDKLILTNHNANRLREAISSVLEITNDNAGSDTIRQSQKDLSKNNEIIKSIISSIFIKKFGNNAPYDKLFIKFHEVDFNIFHCETNIWNIFNLNKESDNNVITRCLLDLTNINAKLEEMKTYNAISIFSNDDISIFCDKIGFIANEFLPETNERRFNRILQIKKYTDIIPLENIKVDINKLLEIRETPECREFREWLSNSDTLTDFEIAQRSNSLRTRLAIFFNSFGGRSLRLLIPAGLSFIPDVGIFAGLTAGALDLFLLEKVLPYSKPIAFIDRIYPSIFK